MSENKDQVISLKRRREEYVLEYKRYFGVRSSFFAKLFGAVKSRAVFSYAELEHFRSALHNREYAKVEVAVSTYVIRKEGKYSRLQLQFPGTSELLPISRELSELLIHEIGLEQNS